MSWTEHSSADKSKKITKLFDDRYGVIGNVKEYKPDEDSVLIVQLPRTTDQLSETYISHMRDRMRLYIPESVGIIFVGADVEMAEIAAEEATGLRLAGII